MAWRCILLGLLLLVSSHSLFAVANISTGTSTPTFNTTPPTSTNIPDWQTGWAQPAVQPTGFTSTTGWNYVGSINGSQSGQASGVYLGNGWVITCGHLGTGNLNFTLNGTTYPYLENSLHTFTGTATQTVVTSSGTTTSSFVNPVDILLYQVSPAPSLPALHLRQTGPVLNSSYVAMIGYGDGQNKTNETWGYDKVNYLTSVFVNLEGLPYWTNDFATENGSADEYQLVGGDSGGAEFIFNSSTSTWELAGLNEGTFTGGSVFVELSNATFSSAYGNTPATGDTTTYTGTTVYETQIEQAMTPVSDTPAMPLWALVTLGGLLALVAMPCVLSERR